MLSNQSEDRLKLTLQSSEALPVQGKETPTPRSDNFTATKEETKSDKKPVVPHPRELMRSKGVNLRGRAFISRNSFQTVHGYTTPPK